MRSIVSLLLIFLMSSLALAQADDPIFEGEVFAVAVTPDGRVAAWAYETIYSKGVRVRDFSDDDFGFDWEIERGMVRDVALSPDGQWLAYGGSFETLIEIRSLVDGERTVLPVLELVLAEFPFVSAVAFSPDGRYLALGTSDYDIIVWDMLDNIEVSRMLGHTFHANDLAFSPDGVLLASASDDNSVRLWQVATGEQLDLIPGPITTRAINRVQFSPDGTLLVIGQKSGGVRLFDWQAGEEWLRVTDIARGEVTAMAYTDGLLVTASDDTLQFWAGDSPVVEPIQFDYTIHDIALSADGAVLLIGSNGLWLRDVVQ